jgi:hypothetical protein
MAVNWSFKNFSWSSSFCIKSFENSEKVSVQVAYKFHNGASSTGMNFGTIKTHIIL